MITKDIHRGAVVQCDNCWFGDASCPHYGAATGTEECIVVDVNAEQVTIQIPTTPATCEVFKAELLYKVGGCYEMVGFGTG
jgi:hypothetical protein